MSEQLNLSYQFLHLTFVFILTILFILIFSFSKKVNFIKKLSYLLKIGLGMAVIGLFVSHHVSGKPIYDLAVFKEYSYTIGFIRVYLVGLAMIVTIPILVIINLILWVFKK